MIRNSGWGRWVRSAALLLPFVLGGLVMAPVHSAAQTQKPIQSRKLTRELAIMEKIIDQMLLDSQNFLVYSQPETRGLYLEEFGILFSFQASLVNRGNKDLKGLFNFDISTDDQGNVTIQRNDKDKGGGKKDDESTSEEDRAETDRLMKKLEESRASREEKLYTQGKAEILDLLLDYGDTITSLNDNQWLAIAAYLKGSDYFLNNKISRLVLKARAGDIRAYSAGRLSREAMLARVVEEEY